MPDVQHRFVETNGIQMHIAEQGTGPLVILCHGFPESWYSWRHQLAALAAAGYRAVAPDMRGYGQTDRPDEISQYSLLHLVGDMVGLVAALGEEQAVIAGHDWGAPVAWHAALMRPEVFRAVIGLSVPFRPRGAVRPSSVMPRAPTAQFYQLYFQTPGVAEAELERDVRLSIRTILTSGFGDDAAPDEVAMVPIDGGLLTHMTPAATLPDWLTEADIDYFAAEFTRTGFRSALNWYRNIDTNWEMLAPFAGARVAVPALYMVGGRDLVLRFAGMDQLLPNLKTFVSQLRRTLIFPSCSHWTQQERAEEVGEAMINFLNKLPSLNRLAGANA